MTEDLLIRHAAPTLAGLKTANLVNCRCDNADDLLSALSSLNRRLGSKGVRVMPLRVWDGRALVYIYRPQRLQADLKGDHAGRLLESRGYSCGTPGRCMMQLMERLSSGGEFPHEIGLFLGYPPEDVEGFIRNKAECSKCCGHWKVYGDEHRARDLFNRYNQCTQVYCAQWMAGKSLEDLTVQIGQTNKMRRSIA